MLKHSYCKARAIDRKSMADSAVIDSNRTFTRKTTYGIFFLSEPAGLGWTHFTVLIVARLFLS